jgi:hypothetical protein
MSGMPDIICAACGGDLTLAREFWDNKSVLRPLLSVEVMPCTTCMSRAAEEVENRAPWGSEKPKKKERGKDDE